MREVFSWTESLLVPTPWKSWSRTLRANLVQAGLQAEALRKHLETVGRTREPASVNGFGLSARIVLASAERHTHALSHSDVHRIAAIFLRSVRGGNPAVLFALSPARQRRPQILDVRRRVSHDRATCLEQYEKWLPS